MQTAVAASLQRPRSPAPLAEGAPMSKLAKFHDGTLIVNKCQNKILSLWRHKQQQLGHNYRDQGPKLLWKSGTRRTYHKYSY